MPEFGGEIKVGNKRFAVVVSRFNSLVTERLLDGARQAFRENGVPEAALDVVWVPGAWELPVATATLAKMGIYDAIVCLGAVIRGETAHFEHIAREASAGIAATARETGLPILFAILTTDTLEQALDRAGGKTGNRGYDAAMGALEMANLMDQLADIS
ncbi:MAG: 6,7-dimethyl-8-ribityllumazine synthase [Chloroflexi bacterium]|nr:6,7-dimethyl-8-ribityllumazine synthase [Chloroflexota bacterium]